MGSDDQRIPDGVGDDCYGIRAQLRYLRRVALLQRSFQHRQLPHRLRLG